MSVTCAGLLRGRFIAVSHCNGQAAFYTEVFQEARGPEPY